MIINTAIQIPYPYIRGSEMGLISNNKDTVLEGDDGIHQVLTTLRQRLNESPSDSLRIIDSMAAQFGVMPTDPTVALSVSRQCGFLACDLG